MTANGVKILADDEMSLVEVRGKSAKILDFRLSKEMHKSNARRERNAIDNGQWIVMDGNNEG